MQRRHCVAALGDDDTDDDGRNDSAVDMGGVTGLDSDKGDGGSESDSANDCKDVGIDGIVTGRAGTDDIGWDDVGRSGAIAGTGSLVIGLASRDTHAGVLGQGGRGCMLGMSEGQ